ncbi:hypothetical protein GA0070616_0926 [Micromonospora nigra]|uniref:Uncharacterized protein n=1 Tax=Micromonospora nigra TaxID=145857 RepID=A0A1C6RG86_9ACTN|nr:hypothetical protein [Micromonospora nigra]SCL16096.1 hypothetical protein GA0070616_0926 [Micromonospora nigra]
MSESSPPINPGSWLLAIRWPAVPRRAGPDLRVSAAYLRGDAAAPGS